MPPFRSSSVNYRIAAILGAVVVLFFFLLLVTGGTRHSVEEIASQGKVRRDRYHSTEGAAVDNDDGQHQVEHNKYRQDKHKKDKKTHEDEGKDEAVSHRHSSIEEKEQRHSGTGVRKLSKDAAAALERRKKNFLGKIPGNNRRAIDHSNKHNNAEEESNRDSPDTSSKAFASPYEKNNQNSQHNKQNPSPKPFSESKPELPVEILDLLSRSSMPNFDFPLHGENEQNENCAPNSFPERESKSNIAFAKLFSRLMKEEFPPERGGNADGSGLTWVLDEGGLIGASRAGAMANADDDFDFFSFLPFQWSPCVDGSLTCDDDAVWERTIHQFLSVFWHQGNMCVRHFHPDFGMSRSGRRLMYSLQMNRPKNVPALKCFDEKKPFAHMHLGIFDHEGKLRTNVWIPKGSTHKKDVLDLNLILPVGRCRVGSTEAPCPHNVTGYLTQRNGGEYRRGGDGSCLLVRQKWGHKRKVTQAELVRKLHGCGYSSMADLAGPFEESGFKTC